MFLSHWAHFLSFHNTTRATMKQFLTQKHRQRKQICCCFYLIAQIPVTRTDRFGFFFFQAQNQICLFLFRSLLICCPPKKNAGRFLIWRQIYKQNRKIHKAEKEKFFWWGKTSRNLLMGLVVICDGEMVICLWWRRWDEFPTWRDVTVRGKMAAKSALDVFMYCVFTVFLLFIQSTKTGKSRKQILESFCMQWCNFYAWRSTREGRGCGANFGRGVFVWTLVFCWKKLDLSSVSENLSETGVSHVSSDENTHTYSLSLDFLVFLFPFEKKADLAILCDLWQILDAEIERVCDF